MSRHVGASTPQLATEFASSAADPDCKSSLLLRGAAHLAGVICRAHNSLPVLGCR